MTQGKLFSQVELAHIMGVRTSTIREWEAAGCPVERKAEKAGQPSLYRSADVIAWDRERAVRTATGNLAAADLNELRRRKLAAEVTLAELAVEQKRGTLVELATVLRLFGSTLLKLRARLLSIGPIVAPRLELATTTPERREIVDDAVMEALDEISDNPFDFFTPEGGPVPGMGQDDRGEPDVAA